MKILKFETKHCPMCRALDISISKLKLEVEHIDAEEDDTQTNYFGITSVPTLLMLDDNGDEVKRTGYIGLLELREWAKAPTK